MNLEQRIRILEKKIVISERDLQWDDEGLDFETRKAILRDTIRELTQEYQNAMRDANQHGSLSRSYSSADRISNKIDDLNKILRDLKENPEPKEKLPSFDEVYQWVRIFRKKSKYGNFPSEELYMKQFSINKNSSSKKLYRKVTDYIIKMNDGGA